MENKANVSTRSPRFEELHEKRTLVRDLMGGTKAMIEAGGRWLLKHPAEGVKVYETRLNQNILTNFLSKDVNKAVGKILKDDIQIQDDVPTEIETLCENIDRQGQALDPFIRDLLGKAFVDGISYILADTPKVEKATTNISKADAKTLGLRPYAVAIKAEDLLEVLSEAINGVQTLTRIRIRETTQVPDGDWGYKTVEQIRVLIRDTTGLIRYELWEEIADAAKSEKEWQKVDEGTTSLKRIPLVAIYTNRCGFMEGEPVFQDTAELNLEHWRSKSEQLHALTFARFAMLTALGVSKEDDIEIGPSKVLKSSNPNASFSSVSLADGGGIEQGWKHLETIEKAIETASANLRIESAGGVTATAAAIDSKESNAGLQAVANGLKDSIETLFMYIAEMLGLGEDSGGEVEIPFDAGQQVGTDTGLTAVTAASASGALSRENYLKELVRRGELPEDFDYDENEEQLKATGLAMPPTEEQMGAGAEKKKGTMKKGKKMMSEEME